MPYNYSTEEEFFEERKKKILKIGLVLVFSFLLIFVLVKVFVLKPKKLEEAGSKMDFPSKIELEEIKLSWPGQKKVEIFSDVFLELINIENYEIEGITSLEGFKFISLEIELENKKNDLVAIRPWGQSLTGVGEERAYNPIPPRTASDLTSPPSIKVRKPDINIKVAAEKVMERNSKEKGYVSFEIPEKMTLKEIIFYVGSKKIIYQISPP